MIPIWRNIHPSFTLNGVSHSVETLLEVSYDLIKSGKPFEKHIGDFLLDWFGKNEHVFVKTSGSTGAPKTIPLKKAHMVKSALATGTFFNLEPDHKALLCLPSEFIAGKMMLVRALVLGLQLWYKEPNSNPLQRHTQNFDFCAMVPLQVENSLDHLSKVKKLLIGGAKVSTKLERKLLQVSCKAFETYGMTETITHIAARPIDGNTKNFEVLPNVHVTKDTRDCLLINAPQIGVKKLPTNDLVKMDGETSFQLLGRYDNVINSGGVKLIPEQIEAKLAKIIPGRFFVAGLEDEKLGQKLVLVFEGTTIKTKTATKEIERLMVLSKYEKPKLILQVERFVETENGKINRKATLKQILA